MDVAVMYPSFSWVPLAEAMTGDVFEGEIQAWFRGH